MNGVAGYSAPSELIWSAWVPLEGAGRDARLPRLAGLYRIRSVQTGRILYIGQTGRTLKERMGALKGVYGEVMPYSDPHTAGPALWAHRIEFGETFEVSVAVLDVDRADRMGREANVSSEVEPPRQRLRRNRSRSGHAARCSHGRRGSFGRRRQRRVAVGGQ